MKVLCQLHRNCCFAPQVYERQHRGRCLRDSQGLQEEIRRFPSHWSPDPIRAAATEG